MRSKRHVPSLGRKTPIFTFICEAKVAVTVVAAETVTVQVPEPLHGPLQLVKVDPAAGVAVSVTVVPLE